MQYGPLLWEQGMFLLPQHFQWQDQYHETQRQLQQHLCAPFGWGVKSLVINTDALQRYELAIQQFELKTQEGTILCFQQEDQPSNSLGIPARSFEAFLDPGGHPLSVFLALKRLQPHDSNVSFPQKESGETDTSDCRYIARDMTYRDRYTIGEHTGNLRYLVYNVRLLFGDTAAASSDDELIKIAEVQRADNGNGAELSDTYIPPCITVCSSSALEKLIVEIQELLTTKSTELCRPLRKDGTNALQRAEVREYVMAQTVNRYTPLFHDILENRYLPPVSIYTLLRQLVGDLSTFSENVTALGEQDGAGRLPQYRHEQLGSCFTAATQRVKELLRGMTTGTRGEVQFKPLSDGNFGAQIPSNFFRPSGRYYLALETKVSLTDLDKHFSDKWKVMGREEMSRVQTCYLRGLPLKPVEVVPDELRGRAHYRFFEIDHDSPYWQKIQHDACAHPEHASHIIASCPELPVQTDMRLIPLYTNGRGDRESV